MIGSDTPTAHVPRASAWRVPPSQLRRSRLKQQTARLTHLFCQANVNALQSMPTPPDAAAGPKAQSATTATSGTPASASASPAGAAVAGSMSTIVTVQSPPPPPPPSLTGVPGLSDQQKQQHEVHKADNRAAAAAKNRRYWAAGTGYGHSGAAGEKWDVEAFLAAQREQDRLKEDLLQVRAGSSGARAYD